MAKLSKAKQQTVLMRAGRYIAMATQLPFMVAAGYGLGYLLDNWLGTSWLKVACLIIAIVGAFAQIIRQVLKDQHTKS